VIKGQDFVLKNLSLMWASCYAVFFLYECGMTIVFRAKKYKGRVLFVKVSLNVIGKAVKPYQCDKALVSRVQFIKFLSGITL
jgi:hypothetical protein